MITKSEFNILAKKLDLRSQDSWSKDYWIKHKDRYFNNLLLIDKYCSGTKILEIGSYPFHQTLLLKKMNYNITGFDLNPERQMQFINDNKLNIIKNNIENDIIPFENNTFDSVLLFELFEHLRMNPIDVLSKIYKVLIPKGKLLLSTPNLYSIYNIGRFISGKGINNGFVEFNKLNTIGHMGHIREYTVKEMIDFLSNCGFINIEICRFSTKTREGVTLGKIIKNFTTDLIETLFPRVKTHLFIIAEKPDKFGINK